MAKHFSPFLENAAREIKRGKKVGNSASGGENSASPPPLLSSISARVGSISDNRLGGWYSYRASKSALNQFTKTLGLELGRKGVACIAVHPGTVATDLSQPFQRNVAPEKVHVEDTRVARMLQHLLCFSCSIFGSFGPFSWVSLRWKGKACHAVPAQLKEAGSRPGQGCKHRSPYSPITSYLPAHLFVL